MTFPSKQTHMFDYFNCYHTRIWVAHDQTQSGSFSRERKEPGNKVELNKHITSTHVY